MKKSNKLFIITFFTSGLIYAGLMAASNYRDGHPFSLGKFMFHFVFFGLFMGFVIRYNHNRLEKKRKKDQEKE